MKILLINNFHYHRGGAERAYFDLKKILENNGHEVAHFSTKHPRTIPSNWDKYFVSYYELGEDAEHSLLNKIRVVFRIWYNFETRRKLRELLKEFKPDVAHLHNIFHHLSPSVIDELKKQGVPMVMTLHDFQFVCPNNILFANGKIWEESKNGKFYKCVSDKCVRGSYLKSFVCMIETYLHKLLGMLDKVEVLTAPSDFLSAKAREFGFKRKIIKLPNPIIFGSDVADCDEEKDSRTERYVLYFGRLSEEKGVDDLLEAFEKVRTDAILCVAGDGPERAKLEQMVGELKINSRVRFLGHIGKKKLNGIIKKALFVVSPSRCYENAPYTILETMSLKKLIICANLGGPNEIVKDGKSGLLFEAGNRDNLAKKIEFALANKEEAERMAQNGYLDVIKNNSSEVFLNKLKGVYEQAITSRQKSNKEDKKKS